LPPQIVSVDEKSIKAFVGRVCESGFKNEKGLLPQLALLNDASCNIQEGQDALRNGEWRDTNRFLELFGEAVKIDIRRLGPQLFSGGDATGDVSVFIAAIVKDLFTFQTKLIKQAFEVYAEKPYTDVVTILCTETSPPFLAHKKRAV
jgi:hypothetical protein